MRSDTAWKVEYNPYMRSKGCWSSFRLVMFCCITSYSKISWLEKNHMLLLYSQLNVSAGLNWVWLNSRISVSWRLAGTDWSKVISLTGRPAGQHILFLPHNHSLFLSPLCCCFSMPPLSSFCFFFSTMWKCGIILGGYKVFWSFLFLLQWQINTVLCL